MFGAASTFAIIYPGSKPMININIIFGSPAQEQQGQACGHEAGLAQGSAIENARTRTDTTIKPQASGSTAARQVGQEAVHGELKRYAESRAPAPEGSGHTAEPRSPEVEQEDGVGERRGQHIVRRTSWREGGGGELHILAYEESLGAVQLVPRTRAAGQSHLSVAQTPWPHRGSMQTVKGRRQKKARHCGCGTALPMGADKVLVVWISDLRKEGVPIATVMLHLQALEVAAAFGVTNFHASWSWVKAFESASQIHTELHAHTITAGYSRAGLNEPEVRVVASTLAGE
ncbi:hypothetical protein ON010_g16876 [Phytophthora cinnamomi]|nr:hypothetical protein ON010_g16876 [Phytophthora cinnamomi]